MALSIYTKTCAKNIAGNNAVLVTEASNIDSVTVDASGEVTAIVMNGAGTFKQLQADMDSIRRLEDAAGSDVNVSYTHSVQMGFAKASLNLNTLRDSLAAASPCGIVAIVQDANGKCWMVGYNEVDKLKRALRLVTDSYASGNSPADEDVQKADVILESISGYTALPLDSALNTALTSALAAGGGTAIEWSPTALGPELVVNGDFDTDTVWVKDTGVTISAGAAHFAAVASGDGMTQSGILATTTTYRVVFTISNFSAGQVRARVGFTYGTLRSANGTYEEDITTAAGTSLTFSGGTGSATMDIDVVSCKEVL